MNIGDIATREYLETAPDERVGEVRTMKHDEELRGRQLIRCEVRIRTDQDTIIATGEGYGAEDALSIALDTLERNVLELKGRRHDEQYRGQLFRKLGEL